MRIASLALLGPNQRRYARKLVHMWHGTFRVSEICGDYTARLEIAGTSYRLFPVVHVFKFKRVVKFSDRLDSVLVVDRGHRVHFG